MHLSRIDHRQIAPRQCSRRRRHRRDIQSQLRFGEQRRQARIHPRRSRSSRRPRSSECSTRVLPCRNLQLDRRRRSALRSPPRKYPAPRAKPRSPAAAPRPSESPDTRPLESKAARPRAFAIPDPWSRRTTPVATGPLAAYIRHEKFRRAHANIRQKNRCAITAARRTPEKVRHKRHDRDVRLQMINRAPAACAAAVLPCDPRVTVILRPAARPPVTSRISPSI